MYGVVARVVIFGIGMRGVEEIVKKCFSLFGRKK